MPVGRRRCSTILPGTAEAHVSSPPRCASRQRRPPRRPGRARCRRRWAAPAGAAGRRSPRRASAAARPLEQEAVLEAAAGERDARLARPSRATATMASTRALWKRAAIDPAGRRPRAHVGEHRLRPAGAQSSTSAGRRRAPATHAAVDSSPARRGSAANSSSIAAWPSKLTRWRRPSSAATASKSRPALVVTGALTPRAEHLRRAARRSLGAKARTGGRSSASSASRRTSSHSSAERDAPRLAHRRVAAGQAERAQVRDAREAGARRPAGTRRPRSCRRRRSRAVPDDAERRPLERRSRPGRRRGGRGGAGPATHAAAPSAAVGAPARPLRREVVGVQVVGDRRPAAAS